MTDIRPGPIDGTDAQMAIVVNIRVRIVCKHTIGGRDGQCRILGGAIAVRKGDWIVVRPVDRHHNVRCDRSAIVVINGDGRGNSEALADRKKVKILVDDLVAPVDVAGIGVARLRGDRDGPFEQCDLGGSQLRSIVMRRILPRDGLQRGVDACGRRPIVEIGIGECDHARGCVRCQAACNGRLLADRTSQGGLCCVHGRGIVRAGEDNRHVLGCAVAHA